MRNKIIGWILAFLPVIFIGLIGITAIPALEVYSILITGIMVILAFLSTLVWDIFHITVLAKEASVV